MIDKETIREFFDSVFDTFGIIVKATLKAFAYLCCIWIFVFCPFFFIADMPFLWGMLIYIASISCGFGCMIGLMTWFND